MKRCFAFTVCVTALAVLAGCGQITCEDERSCDERSVDGASSESGSTDGGGQDANEGEMGNAPDRAPDHSEETVQGDSDARDVPKGDADAATDGIGTPADADAAPGDPAIMPPRLIGPLSTATVTSRRPRLRWTLAAGTSGARVQVCRDRACTDIVTEFDVANTSAAPSSELPPGVLFWRAFGLGGGKRGLAPSTAWQFTVGARSAPVDTSWGTTVDVNGDGYADVIVSAPGQGTLMRGYGRVYVYLGGPAGLATTPVLTLRPPGVDTDGGTDVEAFGASVASAGDVNGDGYGDIVVGDYWTAHAYVYLGGASGLSSMPLTLQPPSDADGGLGLGGFGSPAASAGDLNGDGYADLIVGAPSSSDGGRAFIYLGGPSGPPSAPAMTLWAPSGARDSFGTALASAGDVNADGYADVVVGATGFPGSGSAYVYHGSASGLSSTPVTTLRAPDTDGGSNDDSFGGSVACAGDVNADGFTDIIVGAALSSARGRAYVYLGRASGLSDTPIVTLRPPDVDSGATHDDFGKSVATAGDVNGDGYSDVIVGAWWDGRYGGRAYVFFGEMSGLSASTGVPLQRPGGSAADQFGVSVAGGGDVNRDGYADFIVGAWQANNQAGRAYVYFGEAGTPRVFSPATLDRPSEGGDGGAGPAGFGGSVANLEAWGSDESQAGVVRFRAPRLVGIEERRPRDTGERPWGSRVAEKFNMARLPNNRFAARS